MGGGEARVLGPSIPDVIDGKYQVLGEIGRGGMGVVLAARHLQLNHDVAIKLLLDQAALDPVVVARFLREAKTSLAIKSEHVVRIMDVGTVPSGAPYMVMERLVGEDLETLLRTRPLSLAETLDYVLQACEAIAEAHALGIVHRDLKPANLFRTFRTDGSPLIKVLDFGISKLKSTATPAPSLTATASLLGSPSYMSPEQIRSAKTVDERTDLWALGLILYELLARHLPFTGDHLGALHAAILMDPPRPLAQFRPDLPPEFIAVVERCLEKDLSKRMPSVADLARALTPFTSALSSTSVARIVAVAHSGVHATDFNTSPSGHSPSGHSPSGAPAFVRPSTPELVAGSGRPGASAPHAPGMRPEGPSVPPLSRTDQGRDARHLAEASSPKSRTRSRLLLGGALALTLGTGTVLGVTVAVGLAGRGSARPADSSGHAAALSAPPPSTGVEAVVAPSASASSRLHATEAAPSLPGPPPSGAVVGQGWQGDHGAPRFPSGSVRKLSAPTPVASTSVAVPSVAPPVAPTAQPGDDGISTRK